VVLVTSCAEWSREARIRALRNPPKREKPPLPLANLTFREVRTAADNVVVVVFKGDVEDMRDAQTADRGKWRVNGRKADEVQLFATQSDPSEYHVYLVTKPLTEGETYEVRTPYGEFSFTFRARETLCESIKTNQVAYAPGCATRHALFAIWLGTGGARSFEGTAPAYEVFREGDGETVSRGTLQELGPDESSGDHVYRIDLADVPEGGPYRVAVEGVGCSYPFGVGGEFSRRLAHQMFRAQFLQRCGCPATEPYLLREKPCHTLVYDVDGPIGEANVDVEGTEPTMTVYGGYHDAGDADRRAYHAANPIVNLMIYETFPDIFPDGQFDIPGEFGADYNILSNTNGIPDIIDEAEWGALVWEYLQNDDGTVHFGTETRGYPDPFDAPMDKDTKKYGTVRTDPRATCPAAGLFLHLARALEPYKPERAEELLERGRRAFAAGEADMAPPERLYYYVQLYLLTGDEEAHAKVRELHTVAAQKHEDRTCPPGYSLNDNACDNVGYFLSYVLEQDRPTDPEVVAFFKGVLAEAADESVAELRARAYPVGNDASRGGWGHNVRQNQYAWTPLVQWKLTGDQAYFDAACELLDYKLGLNPIGISYATALGWHQVHNPHDRECAYTRKMGWGNKPGITVFGPGIGGGRSRVIPEFRELSRERQFIDDMGQISFTEFTIFETMPYDALYAVVAGGGKWNGVDPYDPPQPKQ
jgi:endoglucanase